MRKLVILILFFGFVGFGIGGYLIGRMESIKVVPTAVPNQISVVTPQNSKYSVKKEAGSKNDPSSYKYSLIRSDSIGKSKTIYAITNWFGFIYEVSKDDKYIAILNNGESMGDETLVLILNDGTVLKEFGHLESPQSLIPIYWTDHYFWMYMGIPIGQPAGVLRINAETLEVDRYLNSPFETTPRW